MKLQDPRGPARARGEGGPIEAVIIHPPVRKAFVASEHPEGELDWLGDALGMDFIVVWFVDGWTRSYKGDGKANSDWFGWNEDVLAPCDGVVRLVTESVGTNTPGSHSGGCVGGLVFERETCRRGGTGRGGVLWHGAGRRPARIGRAAEIAR